ncbi:MAG: DUF6036 family nucleotidyltransferase [Bacilli bacterium]|jgi:hypothetical protein|nr:DUF6036 family nucleotidyltransferase [Bacilli bacterium]
MWPNSKKKIITKETLDLFLTDLAKAFRRLNGRQAKAELVLVGGTAVLTNYSFRESTSDMDAVINTTSSLEDAIKQVSEKYDIPGDWLNDDVKKTASFTYRLIEFSTYYKTYSGVIEVRALRGQYLIAMKLKSGREYKNDLSDILGILMEQKQQGKPLSFSDVDQAMIALYGSWDDVPEFSLSFIKDCFASKNYAVDYEKTLSLEKDNRKKLQDFQRDYPDILLGVNASEVLKALREKKEKK